MEKKFNDISKALEKLFSPLRKVLGNFYYPFFLILIFIILQLLFSLPIVQDTSTENLVYVPLLDGSDLRTVVLILINIVMTVSLCMVNGFTGQFSIGHAAFMALGAYASVFVTTILGKILGPEGVGYIFNTATLLYSGEIGLVLLSYAVFLFSLLLGGAVAGIGGYLIGMPTLKLKGDYLAIVTMAFCEVIGTMIRVSETIGKSLGKMYPDWFPGKESVTKLALQVGTEIGGPRGITPLPKFLDVSTFFFVFFFCVISVYFMRNYLFSSYGRACKAIRDNDIAAEAMGVNTTKQKIHVFVISSFIAGVCGGILVHFSASTHPDLFTFVKSLDYLIYLYIGGVGTISGAATGATLFTFIPEFFRFLGQWRMVIYPLVLIIVMLLRSEGLVRREFRIILTKKLRRSSKTT